MHTADPFALPFATLTHLVLAIGALLLGPLALYSRSERPLRNCPSR